MRRSQQAFSVPSKQTQSSNAKDELSSTASINASSTTLIPSSKLLASKPRDCTLKREQNSCYEHDNGLSDAVMLQASARVSGYPPFPHTETTVYRMVYRESTWKELDNRKIRWLPSFCGL